MVVSASNMHEKKTCCYFDCLTNDRAIDECGGILVFKFDNLLLNHEGADTEHFNLQGRNNKKWYSNSFEKNQGIIDRGVNPFNYNLAFLHPLSNDQLENS